jgi:hypothetical protein
MRFIGTMANWRDAPPCNSRMEKSSGTEQISRSRSMVSWWIWSYTGSRWLISISDMPVSAKSGISSASSWMTDSGRVHGPAQKLWTRFISVISGL